MLSYSSKKLIAVGKSGRGLPACALILFVAGCAVNPVTGEQQLMLMSEAQEVQTGEEAYPMYTQMSEGLFQDPGLQAYAQEVGGRLAGLSHRPELNYRFNVVNASEINAYALPGGKISITRGLVERMDNEAQFASVLGHEIGHVTARHAASGYTRQVLAGVITSVGLVALQTANIQGGELLAQGGMLATNLVLMKYSRDQERQSDELGMEYMTRAGHNPEGMAQTMEILLRAQKQEPSAVESLFMSHPLSSERLDTAKRMAAGEPAALRTEDRLGRDRFQKATERVRALAPAYAKMDEGRKALAEGKTKQAVGLLDEASRMGPDQALIWVFRAAAHAKGGDKAEAYSSAEKAVSLYPDLYRARFTAGVLAYDLGKNRESLAHLDVANRLVPGQPPVTFFRGRNYEVQGRREEAARAYADVLQTVQKGPMAEYSYRRLVEWGYVRPPAEKRAY